MTPHPQALDRTGVLRQPDAQGLAGPATPAVRTGTGGRGDGGRTAALVSASLLLHVAGAVLAATAIRPARLPDDAAPAMAMVFEAPAPPAPVADPAPPPPESPAEPSPAPPLQQAEPPAADAAPPLPVVAPEPPPTPAPPVADVVQPAPPPPPPAALPAPLPPPVRPAIPPQPPQPAAPAPRPAPKVAARPSALPQTSPPAAAAPASLPSPPPRTAPPAPSGPASPTVAAISRAWQGALSAWVQSRQRYPEAARRQGAEGQVALRVTLNRDGQVLDVQMVRGSGAEVLDQAALAMLRGGRAPPFPADMPQAQVTQTVVARYHGED